jgi:Lar family restriction alleviation protein
MELKPCPFCGRKGCPPSLTKADVDWFCISCNECYTEGPMKDTPEEAAEAWNRRASVEGRDAQEAKKYREAWEALKKWCDHEAESHGAIYASGFEDTLKKMTELESLSAPIAQEEREKT